MGGWGADILINSDEDGGGGWGGGGDMLPFPRVPIYSYISTPAFI